mmetsp:Transcript_20570/g.52220  ORF Transcript_20570/g.52220 Transcript_20570/m.52220 type:complete len:350 (-) Transcript_20570:644-1693(-)
MLSVPTPLKPPLQFSKSGKDASATAACVNPPFAVRSAPPPPGPASGVKKVTRAARARRSSAPACSCAAALFGVAASTAPSAISAAVRNSATVVHEGANGRAPPPSPPSPPLLPLPTVPTFPKCLPLPPLLTLLTPPPLPPPSPAAIATKSPRITGTPSTARACATVGSANWLPDARPSPPTARGATVAKATEVAARAVAVAAAIEAGVLVVLECCDEPAPPHRSISAGPAGCSCGGHERVSISCGRACVAVPAPASVATGGGGGSGGRDERRGFERGGCSAAGGSVSLSARSGAGRASACGMALTDTHALPTASPAERPSCNAAATAHAEHITGSSAFVSNSAASRCPC